MKNGYIIVTNNGSESMGRAPLPCFIVTGDEDNPQPHLFRSLLEANTCAKDQILCKARGYQIIHWVNGRIAKVHNQEDLTE